VDIQALLRRFTVEFAPVEGVPHVRLFCDFRDFCVTYPGILGTVAEAEVEGADGAGVEVVQLEVGAAGVDGHVGRGPEGVLGTEVDFAIFLAFF